MRFPFAIADNGDFCDLAPVFDHEIEIVPIGAAFPAFKVFQDDEQTGLGSSVDLARQYALLAAKFRLFQKTADPHYAEIVRLKLNLCGHIS